MGKTQKGKLRYSKKSQKNMRGKSEEKKTSTYAKSLILEYGVYFFLKKLLFKALIPTLLLGFWLFLSFAYNNRISFSVLEYGDRNAVVLGKTLGKLYKGDIVYGEFKAKENYLGIVFIRFDDFVVPDYRGEDILTFKIKEKGAKTWYYSGNYRSGILKQQLLFPFGFPVIYNSIGKTYIFELKSLYGNTTNGVHLSGNKPIVKTAYQFPKKEIIGSKLRVINFVIKKIISSITDLDFLFTSVVYLTPLILYLSTRIKKQIYKQKLFGLITFLLIIWDIVILKEIYTGILVVLFVVLIFNVVLNYIQSKALLLLSFYGFIIWIIFVYFGVNNFSAKLNIWTYAFFAIGIFKLVFENNKNK